MPTEEEEQDIAEAKAKEEAEAKAKAEAEAAKLKADEDAKVEAERKKAEAARVAAGTGGPTEEQWLALEKQSGMTRQQILFANSIAQAAAQNSPAVKVVEKDAWGEATKDVTDLKFYEKEAREAVATLTPLERQDPKRVREKVMAVRGEKVKSASGDGVTRRVSSGLDPGGGGPGNEKEEDMPEFSGTKDDIHDQQEVFQKFGFSSKKDWDTHTKKVIPVQDENFVPKWR